ncbi:hypothetical protein ACMU_14135 [Actibacterium mucosum KCTC 23349]|uniref:DNA polymerase III subunit gamma/tau n=1 Tax=Actibacterium mucosum KCTC 23349 TaxID=1454373 RepID=A0A037ZH37_9RHOB|nr:SRPBCC family protein [Actibacterium mucosum]KAJ54899.1 hypothetical protein ACMU_14135 [Actibacterium mucosum KCTC 23349]
MKFSAREDISAPIDAVFAALSDFDTAERAALRRGAEVQREDPQGAPGLGSKWSIVFAFRGKARKMKAKVTDFSAPEGMSVQGDGAGLETAVEIQLVALSPRQTRVKIEVEVKPKTITARLFVQSLRLARANLTQRFKDGVHKYIRDMEVRLNGAPRRA